MEEPADSRAHGTARPARTPADLHQLHPRPARYSVQGMALDHRTAVGQYVHVQSVGTLRRLLAYLGAT
jgi:hypothetical protein